MHDSFRSALLLGSAFISDRLLASSRILASCLAVTLGLIVGCRFGFAADQKLPITKMQAEIYSSSFARRFALPAPKEGNEPPSPIQAIHFSIEKGTGDFQWLYTCKLAIYVQNSLRIAYPKGHTGSMRIVGLGNHFFARLVDRSEGLRRWSEQDRNHIFEELQSGYGRTARIGSPTYVRLKEGWGSDIVYEEYHRELFPGLAYLKANVGCRDGRSMRLSATPTALWLKKEGGRDYRHTLDVDRNDFEVFPLPREFVETIAPWMETAANANLDNDAENQRRLNERRRSSEEQSTSK